MKLHAHPSTHSEAPPAPAPRQAPLPSAAPHASIERAGLGQQFGVLTPSSAPIQRVHPLAMRRKMLQKIGASKSPLSHRRSATAFGYLNKAGKRVQGPHTISHVTTGVLVAAIKGTGGKLKGLLGSKLIPRPRITNRLINRIVNHKLDKARHKRKTQYLRTYARLWKRAKGGDEKAVEKLLELAPTQTYKLKTGVATKAEMAGKGERRGAAAADLEKWSKMKKGAAIPAGSKTVDQSDNSALGRRLRSDRARQMGRAAIGEPLSDAEEYGSESDDDVDLSKKSGY